LPWKNLKKEKEEMFSFECRMFSKIKNKSMYAYVTNKMKSSHKIYWA